MHKDKTEEILDRSKLMVDKLSNGPLVKSDYDKDKDISDNASNGFEIDKDDNDKIDQEVIGGGMKNENPYLIDSPDALNQNKPVNPAYHDELPVVLQPDTKPVQNIHINRSQVVNLQQLKDELQRSVEDSDKIKITYIENMQNLPESLEYLRENLIRMMDMGFTDLYKNVTNLKLCSNNLDQAVTKMFEN